MNRWSYICTAEVVDPSPLTRCSLTVGFVTSMMPLARTNSLLGNSSVLRTIGLLLIGASLGILGLLLFRPGSRVPAATTPTDGSSTASPRKSIVALGSLQPRDGIIQISSPLVGYQIKSVLVQEGQTVKAGDSLV